MRLFRTDPDTVQCELHVNFLPTVLFSKLPYDVEPEQALKHPEVRDRIEAAMKRLTTATDTFLNSIVRSGEKIP